MDLQIYGVIGTEGLTAPAIRAQLAGKTEPLNVRICSDGGDAVEGLAIAEVLRRYPGRVTCYIDTLAGSAASVIACAGAEVVMSDGSMLMIHNPHIEIRGDGDTLRGAAAMVDTLAQSYATEYARKMGCSIEDARALMTRADWSVGTWLGAEEALRCGLATRIGPAVKVQARAWPTLTPDAIRQAHAHARSAMDKAAVMAALGLQGEPDYETAEHALMGYLASSEDPPDKRQGVAAAFKAAFGDNSQPGAPAAPGAPPPAAPGAPGQDPDKDALAAALAAALAETKAALAERSTEPDPEKIKEDAAKAEAQFRADVEAWVKNGQIKDSPESRETWLTRHRAGKAQAAVSLLDKGTWTTSQRLRSGNVGTPATPPATPTPPAPTSAAKEAAKRVMAQAAITSQTSNKARGRVN